MFARTFYLQFLFSSPPFAEGPRRENSETHFLCENSIQVISSSSESILSVLRRKKGNGKAPAFPFIHSSSRVVPRLCQQKLLIACESRRKTWAELCWSGRRSACFRRGAEQATLITCWCHRHWPPHPVLGRKWNFRSIFQINCDWFLRSAGDGSQWFLQVDGFLIKLSNSILPSSFCKAFAGDFSRNFRSDSFPEQLAKHEMENLRTPDAHTWRR